MHLFLAAGDKAMSIRENKRKNLCLTPKEYKNSEDLELTNTMARKVVSFMQESRVVTEFRDLSTYVQDLYNGEPLLGPRGHSYSSHKNLFKNSYPSYLQSYEFALLAGSLIRFKERQALLEVIGHYHDGCVLALPSEGLDEGLMDLQRIVRDYGEGLGLKYTQELEVKRTY